MGVTAVSSAQDGTVAIYTCSNNNGCAESPTSGQVSVNDAETIIGETQPSSDHYILCADSSCGWVNIDPADADMLYGGDGIPWQQGEEIDLGPFDPELPIESGAGEFPIVLDPTTDHPYIVTCVAGNCTIRVAKVTFEDAELIFGAPAVGDNPYILCTTICQWWSGELPLFDAIWIPADGAWQVEAGMPTAQNCSVDIGPEMLDEIMAQTLGDNLPDAQAGTVTLTFSEPPVAQDFFPTLTMAGMSFRKLGMNTYRALLDRSEDGTTALVVYTLTVESPTHLTGDLRVTIRNAAIGCTLISPLDYTYVG